MGRIKNPLPALLTTAVFSRYEEAFSWAEKEMESLWGKVALKSDPFDFSYTNFYESEMGFDLKKRIYAFEKLISQSDLAEIKNTSNVLEKTYADKKFWPEERPINIDPGYLTEAKFVLASAKDRDHRICIGSGIYAEVTLFFRDGCWNTRPWTYPDYQQREIHEFLNKCKSFLREKMNK